VIYYQDHKKQKVYTFLFVSIQVKAQYSIMMESIKQTSLLNLQGELDVDTMSGQVRGHQAQQALSLHKVDMEASVMEVNPESKVYTSIIVDKKKKT